MCRERRRDEKVGIRKSNDSRAEEKVFGSFPRTWEWTFSGKKTQCFDPNLLVIELRLLSLFVERSQAGWFNCGWKLSERVIIDDNRLFCADFGAI